MMKSPALEAEYAHDDRTSLGLYDCLVPRLREHRKLKIRAGYKMDDIIADIKA